MSKSSNFFTKKGYGKFPYIILRETSGVYRQIPILNLDEISSDKEGLLIKSSNSINQKEFENLCIETFLKFILNKPIFLKTRYHKTESRIIIKNQKEHLSGCIVFDTDRAVYFSDNKLEDQDSIPWGGELISLCDEKIEFDNKNHFIDVNQIHQEEKNFFQILKELPFSNDRIGESFIRSIKKGNSNK